jgi:dUTP pyrophosphatase
MKIEAGFERITKYQEDNDVKIPNRKTAASAGYDFYAAEDTIVPAYDIMLSDFQNSLIQEEISDKERFKTIEDVDKAFNPISLADFATLTKKYKFKPTLVPTGIKCKMPEDIYLQLSVRSSLPLKDWLVLANGVGIIDADYYNNPDNEGHIYFQLINFSPFPILIKKGDCFG